MKKLVLFLTGFFFLLNLNAQYSIETTSGEPINEGDTFTFSETEAGASKLPFRITNNSSETIYMRVQFVSAQNWGGDNMQLCITPKCYYTIIQGQSYPQEQGAMSVPIPAGEQTGYGNYLKYTGSSSEAIEFTFKFYQVDASGNAVGNSTTITYRYDPNLAVEDIEQLNIAAYPTQVENYLTVEANENLTMRVFNLQGRLVKTAKLPSGQNQINMSNLSPQLYLVRFRNQQGQMGTTKIVVE